MPGGRAARRGDGQVQIIDLTMPVAPHWRFPILLERVQSHERGDVFQASTLTVSVHGFTHVDAPRHCVPGGPTIESVPLETVCGPATILDVSHAGPNHGITPEELAAAGEVNPGDLILLRSAWERQVDYTTRDFWLRAPYLTPEAARWLADRRPRAVGFDFPQDYVIRELVSRQPALDEFPTHALLLAEGIILIEYLINLSAIPGRTTLFMAAPLKVPGSDGGPTRAVAIEL
jgi:arylformamidase